MRFRLVTVAILLAIASSGDGRPGVPDPLAGSTQESSSGGNPNSRYTRRSHPPTSYGRRVISITSAKFDRSDHRLIPGLSFESDRTRKNYLPLGALSSSARTTNFYFPLTTPMTIPVGRSLVDPIPSSPKPIPVSINEGRSFFSRKMDSRTLVRIVPQKLRPGFNSRRNLTSSKFKDSLANLHLKNWPNEAVQSVQDLLNYEKYTSFHDDDKNSVEISRPKITSNRQPSNKRPGTQKPDNSWTRVTTTQKPDNSWTRVPTTQKPEIIWTRVPTTQKPETIWTRIPATETTTLPTTKFEYETTMRIDNLLDDLAQNKRLPQTSSEVVQNTVVHILNAGSKKPNITVVEPSNVKKVNRPKPGRPPQNVHIMFMMDKDDASSGNQTQGRPATEILGGDSDCPTIMINSITQINNTIESKAGCTDLNIVINSHVLNTNIVKPSASTQNVSPGTNTEGPKNPYVTNYPIYNPSTNYPNTYYPNTNYPNNNYPTASYPNSNYNDGLKDPNALSDSPVGGSEPEIQTFEVFQGTHINIGGSQSAADFPDDTGIIGGDEPLGSDVDGPPLSDTGETSNDIAGTAPEEGAADVPVDGGESASGVAQVGQSSFPSGVANDIGEAQAIEGGAGEANLPSLPSLPNLPNLPRPPANNLGSTSGQTGTTPAADEEEDEIDELVEAISPVGLLASISNVFSTISILNPLNYGIFGMAVAPFVAFAAGILGVATFLFPWAFPGYSIPIDVVARAWNDGWSSVNHPKTRYSPALRDIVYSSIQKYRHLNEWKGRRRRKKRKR